MAESAPRKRRISTEEKSRRSNYQKKWTEENRPHVNARAKKYRDEYKTNPEWVKRRKEYLRVWREKNREKTRLSGRDWMRRARVEGRIKPVDPVKKREQTRRWYIEHREQVLAKDRNARILKKHGMTAAEYDKMMAVAVCAACGTKDGLTIDHDHASLHTRGVLCTRCNMALGLVKDDPGILSNLVLYLKTTQRP